MSDFWDRYPPSKKQPPPAEGIRMKKAGTTWWGERWIAALERRAEYRSRLARGKAYARGGRTHDVQIENGRIRAKVTGSRPSPYDVEITLQSLSDAVWAGALRAMAAEARFSAALLAGEMPREIDGAFASSGASLFPGARADLATACSCPDAVNPCKHVAAVCYVIGEALDADPFLLFELRGRSRASILDELRSARSAVAAAESNAAIQPATGEKKRRPRKSPAPAAAAGSDGSFASVTEDDYDAWRTPPPELHLEMKRPDHAGALLGQLGAPRGWSKKQSPGELLVPVVSAAAERALRLAEAEIDGPGDEPPADATRSRSG
jgi:uncharacterized Zn finger protein